MKILLWDIETWPLETTTWTLFPKGPLDHKQLKRDFGIICVAWKWLGQSKVHAVAVDPKDPFNDLEVVKKIHEVIAEADVIVAHNGDDFDHKKLNTRIIYHGLPPLPPIKTIDTLKVARKHFGFSSNRLDYLGKYLGVGRKIPTHYDLWLEIMEGNATALKYMVKYNKQDVLLLEDVYLKLRPFMQQHPNRNLTSRHAPVCPVCGSKDVTKQGFKHSRTATKQQYQCRAEGCRAWFVGESVQRVKYS